MAKPRMYRSSPEYKEMMKAIRVKVNLSKRSELFRSFRSRLTGKHQDTLERSYVRFLEKNNGDSSLAERTAMKELILMFLQRNTARQKEPDNESYRMFEFLLDIKKDILKSMSASEIEIALTKKGYL